MTEKQKQEMDELISQAKAEGRTLKAEDIVDKAKDPLSALHQEFQWDDTEAAKLFRLQQARQVIRNYKIYMPQAKIPNVRGMVSRPGDRTEGGGYRPTQDILARPDWTAEMINEVQKKIEGFRQKYAYLVQLEPLWSKLEQVTHDYLSELRRMSSAG